MLTDIASFPKFYNYTKLKDPTLNLQNTALRICFRFLKTTSIQAMEI